MLLSCMRHCSTSRAVLLSAHKPASQPAALEWRDCAHSARARLPAVWPVAWQQLSWCPRAKATRSRPRYAQALILVLDLIAARLCTTRLQLSLAGR